MLALCAKKQFGRVVAIGKVIIPVKAFRRLIVNNQQLMRFALVGGIAFLIDSGSLHILIFIYDFGYLLGRLVSYLIAATIAWYLHRVFTFRSVSHAGKRKQLFNFVIMNSFGGAANYLVYAVLVTKFAFMREWPIIAVGVGAIVGLLLNYNLSRKIVFRV